MKLLLFLLTAAAALPSTIAIFLTYVPWDVPNNDVKHVTFPMNIANTPKKRGYYFAQYFLLTGQEEGTYIGLQPQDDGTIRAVFSSFAKGATADDANCHDGSDGGPGVTCAVVFDGTHANTYNLEVRNIVGTTWNGTVIDTVTGRSMHIGTFALPTGTGLGLRWHMGFVQYLKSAPLCSELPYTSVVFGVPTTDAGVGSLKDPYEVGDCMRQDNFSFTRTADNRVAITVGSPPRQ